MHSMILSFSSQEMWLYYTLLNMLTDECNNYYQHTDTLHSEFIFKSLFCWYNSSLLWWYLLESMIPCPHCLLSVCMFCILVLWPFTGGRMGLPAALSQLVKVEASHQAFGHSEGSESATCLLWQEPLHSMAHRSVWGRVMALSGFGHPGVWHVTSEWPCQYVLKGPVVITASEVKQGASVCNGCFKTVLKCLCITECVCLAGSGWAWRHRSMAHINIDTCHWGLEAERPQTPKLHEVNWGFSSDCRVFEVLLYLSGRC